jgi:hypothetical protein
MKPMLQHLLMAYQPLRQRGLLLDGRQPSGIVPAASARRQRVALVTLAGLRPLLFRPGTPS